MSRIRSLCRCPNPVVYRRDFSLLSPNDRPARVIVVGSGRMGQIRTSLLRSSPRFELCGIVDTAFQGAENLAKKYRVRDN